jgi:glycosyltransferase involved in cell wall biosynthesis
MRTLLFIAYYLPPMGSSGVQRPLNLLRHLPKYGWYPVVLAPETGLYHTLDQSLEQELNELGLPIYRVKSETPFHVGGGAAKLAPRIPEGLSRVLRWISAFRYLPDNKIGWIDPAFDLAKHIIEKHSPELVFATSPPPSNLMLAAKIRQHTGLPTVFDFRDDWVGNHQQIYPTPWHRRRMGNLEDATLAESDAIITVNPVIQDAIVRRHPNYSRAVVSIPSGYDAKLFENSGNPSLKRDDSTITILYSGRFYGENQPDVFLKALSGIRRKNPQLGSRVRLAFQGGLESRHYKLFDSLGLIDRIVDLGYVDHTTSVANLIQSDLLWLVAAHRNRGEQVSTGKVYEYMASGKPILALAPPEGALHRILDGYGPYQIVSPSNVDNVEDRLVELLLAHTEGTLPTVNTNYVAKFTFENMASHMADMFNSVAKSKIETDRDD